MPRFLCHELSGRSTSVMNDPFSPAFIKFHTIRDWLRFAVSRFNEANLFFGHGLNSAYDEAAYLILHTLHLPLDQLEPFLDAHLLEEESKKVMDVLQTRIHKKLPAPYITNEAWLGEYRFYVDERVIVPRSFIAELLREQLQPWIADPYSIGGILDMCTGSGCLAIIAALVFPNAQVDAVDVSTEALSVAQKNILDYGLESQVSLIESNLFQNLRGRKYDLIISNPPYVNSASMESLPDEYRNEPELALASGEDGLDHIRIILDRASQYLTPNGALVVEAGHNRDELESAFPDLAFQWLEVSAGSEFVFLITRSDLENRQS